MTIIIQKESDTKDVQINNKGKVSDTNNTMVVSGPSDGKERNNIKFNTQANTTTTTATTESGDSSLVPKPNSDALKTPLPAEKDSPGTGTFDYYRSPFSGPSSSLSFPSFQRSSTKEESDTEPMSTMPVGFESIANPEKVEIPDEIPEFSFGGSKEDKDSYGVSTNYDNYRDDADKSERVSLSETIPKPDYYSDFYRSDKDDRKERRKERKSTRHHNNSGSDNESSSRKKRYSSSDDNTDNVTEEQEKGYLLYLLEQMKAKGIHVSRDFSMNSRLKDIKKEYQRIKSRLDAEKSIKFQREMLFTFCSGVEYINQAYDPFGLDLDGWPNQVHDSIEMYDDVFARLHEKYSKKVSKVPPELQLVGMLGMSAIAFNISKKMFASNEPAAPAPSNAQSEEINSMRNMLMKNPDMMKRFIQETTERNGPPPSSTRGPNQAKDAYGRDFMPNQPSSGPPPVQKKEMRGPPGGIDDILKKMKSGYLSSGSEASRKRGSDSDGTVPNSDSDSNVKNVALKRGRRNGVSV